MMATVTLLTIVIFFFWQYKLSTKSLMQKFYKADIFSDSLLCFVSLTLYSVKSPRLITTTPKMIS